MDNIKTWTGLSVEESVRMTEDRDGESTSMVWPTLGSRTAKDQIRSDQTVEFYLHVRITSKTSL